MRLPTHGMLYVGRLEFTKRLHALTLRQRGQVADLLAGYAEGIRELSIVAGIPVIDLYVEADDA